MSVLRIYDGFDNSVTSVFFPLKVGNKDDAPERKQVDPADARRFADQMGIQLFETSAKDNKNVEEVCKNDIFFIRNVNLPLVYVD